MADPRNPRGGAGAGQGRPDRTPRHSRQQGRRAAEAPCAPLARHAASQRAQAPDRAAPPRRGASRATAQRVASGATTRRVSERTQAQTRSRGAVRHPGSGGPAAPARRPETFAVPAEHGRVDHAKLNPPPGPQGHRGAHLRNEVDKVGGAIYGVNDPARAVPRAGHGRAAAFLGKKGGAGQKRRETFLEERLHRKVRFRDQIHGALVPHMARGVPVPPHDGAALAHHPHAGLKQRGRVPAVRSFHAVSRRFHVDHVS